MHNTLRYELRLGFCEYEYLAIVKTNTYYAEVNVQFTQLIKALTQHRYGKSVKFTEFMKITPEFLQCSL